MTDLLLFLILIVLIAQLFDSHKRGDFSKEDEAVKESLAEVKSAKTRVPRQNKPPT